MVSLARRFGGTVKLGVALNATTERTRHRLLGIVVPVYNTEEEYLFPCLESLIQDYYDYEVVVVDDGSNKGTHEACAQFASLHSDCFRLLTKANGGQNSARNTGCRALDTDYVMFVDSDDTLVPGAIPLIASALLENRPDLLVFGFSEGNVDGIACDERVCVGVSPKRALLCKQCSLWGLAIASPLIRAFPLLEGLRMGEDFASVFPLVAKSERICRIDASLYHYAQRPTSTINSSEYRYPLEILKGFDHLLSLGWLTPFRHELEWQAIKHLLVWEPMRLIRSGKGTNKNKRKLEGYMQTYFSDWRKNPYLKDNYGRYGFSFALLTHGCWGLYGALYRLRCLSHRRAIGWS